MKLLFFIPAYHGLKSLFLIIMLFQSPNLKPQTKFEFCWVGWKASGWMEDFPLLDSTWWNTDGMFLTVHVRFVFSLPFQKFLSFCLITPRIRIWCVFHYTLTQFRKLMNLRINIIVNTLASSETEIIYFLQFKIRILVWYCLPPFSNEKNKHMSNFLMNELNKQQVIYLYNTFLKTYAAIRLNGMMTWEFVFLFRTSILCLIENHLLFQYPSISPIISKSRRLVPITFIFISENYNCLRIRIWRWYHMSSLIQCLAFI